MVQKVWCQGTRKISRLGICPQKKNIDTKTHHVYIICPRETMDFPKI